MLIHAASVWSFGHVTLVLAYYLGVRSTREQVFAWIDVRVPVQIFLATAAVLGNLQEFLSSHTFESDLFNFPLTLVAALERGTKQTACNRSWRHTWDIFQCGSSTINSNFRSPRSHTFLIFSSRVSLNSSPVVVLGELRSLEFREHNVVKFERSLRSARGRSKPHCGCLAVPGCAGQCWSPSRCARHSASQPACLICSCLLWLGRDGAHSPPGYYRLGGYIPPTCCTVPYAT